MASTGALGVESDVATRVDTAIAAGAGSHLPVGQWSGADYRSAMRFAQPAWTAWTAITKATLKFYISDHQHVGPQNSSIYCSRMNAPVWTKSAGTQSCENGFTGANNTQSDDIASTSTNRISFSSGSTANAAKTLDVTAMVQYYWGQRTPIVFVFDNNGTDQYTEIWADEKSGYDATLTIEYETNTAPTAPTLTGPANGSTSATQTPTFSWTHNDPQGDAQSNAIVNIYDAAGTTLLYQWATGNANQSLVSQVALTQGVTYRWAVQTADGVLWGPFSAQQSFTIQKANPVVTIKTPRKMTYNGQPRLIVEWSSDQPQGQFLVTAPGYTSGQRSGGDQSWTLDTLALTNGTPVTVTVQVWNTDGAPLTGSSSRAFTPRWGLTTHKRTLAAVPVNWQQPSVVATVPKDAVNGDCALIIEYGTSVAAGDAAPTAWYPSFSSVPLRQYLHWRAWFIPNNVTGPTLDSISVGYDSTIAVLDKWGSAIAWPWEANGGIPARFRVDTGESVYGTRSLRCDPDGSPYHLIYSAKVKVRAGRSYVLSGLMRSQGNSGAWFALQSNPATTLASSVVSLGPPVVTKITGTGLTDWERYKTPVWKATADMDVYVVCVSEGGVAGSTAWWDGMKLEESTVATPWNPATVGATTVDAGGVQIDGSKGGAFRYKGVSNGLRDVVEGGANGLNFGGDTPVSSPSPRTIQVGDEAAAGGGASLNLAGGAGGSEGGELGLFGAGSNQDMRIDNYAGTMRFMDAGAVLARIQSISPHFTIYNDLDLAGELRLSGDTYLRRWFANAMYTPGSLLVQGTAVLENVQLKAPYPVRRVYTSNNTWVTPATPPRYIEVECCGGGGGGGGTAAPASGTNATAGGGGGGGYVKRIIPGNLLSGNYAIVVGGGGGGAAAGANTGGTGGNSTFTGTNAALVGGAGTGGGGMASTTGNSRAGGGNGGGGSGGDYVQQGSDGSGAGVVGGILSMMSYGGASGMGGSGTKGVSVGNSGVAGAPYGGGGTGSTGTSSDVARAGGAGAQGVVIVTEYY